MNEVIGISIIVLSICAIQMALMHRLFNDDYSLRVFEPVYFLYMTMAALPIYGGFIWLLGAMDLDHRKALGRDKRP